MYFPATPLGGNGTPTCSVKPVLLARIHSFACGGQTLNQISDALFWDAIFSTDITSVEGLSNITTLLQSPSKIHVARNLLGDQAQSFIDLIDRVSDLGKRPSVPRVLIMTSTASRVAVPRSKTLSAVLATVG